MTRRSEKELRWIGLNDRQLALLADQSDEMVDLVYDEALRLLIERSSGDDDLRDDLGDWE